MPYKQPPKDKSFKKGESGNPAGRPVGALSMTTKIKEFLMEQGKDGETNGDKLKRAIVLRAITKSDVLAKEILDRVDGKVPQDVTSGGQPLQVIVPPQVAQAFNINGSNSETERGHTEQE